MPLDDASRNRLANAVGACRKRLTEDVAEQLQRDYGLQPDGTALEVGSLSHLDEGGLAAARALREWHAHLAASEAGPQTQRRQAAFVRMAHETAFTVLNRLAALRLCEERKHIVESIRRGPDSDGPQLFGRLAGGAVGSRHDVYRHYLLCLFDELAVDLGPLFDRGLPQSLVFPGERCLEEVLGRLDDPALGSVWDDDETIGWIYQFFNSKEERREMRKAPAPRNSRELAVRNQFFTPRYVVEFLGDNSLGRLWMEMRGGATRLADECRLLVKHTGENGPRPKKDPRDLKVVDVAVGSGHFLLYGFDLLETIYEEAWDDAASPPSEVTGRTLRDDYPDEAAFRRAVPGLILSENLHGVDIDPRAVQIAALALWLRAQRSFERLGLRPADRPPIARTHLVCAEPIPGDAALLAAVKARLDPPVLGRLLEAVVEKLRLAGEMGTLLPVETDIAGTIAEAKKHWADLVRPEQPELIPGVRKPVQRNLDLFSGSQLPDEEFWETAEARILDGLRLFAEEAETAGATRRRLFSQDAAAGFAFIDLCRTKFDVVLMNPPFGEPSVATKAAIEASYSRTKNDLYAAFVERGLRLLHPGGFLGAITSRTGFFLTSFRVWREEILLKEATPIVVADLGTGVLDAMVETAAYVLELTRESAVQTPARHAQAGRLHERGSSV